MRPQSVLACRLSSVRLRPPTLGAAALPGAVSNAPSAARDLSIIKISRHILLVGAVYTVYTRTRNSYEYLLLAYETLVAVGPVRWPNHTQRGGGER